VNVYLVDTSIWSWADRTPGSALSDKLAERAERGELATSPIVVLETLHRARTPTECELMIENYFMPLPSVPLTSAAAERATRVQLELAGSGDGNHRRPAADFLLAASAEEAGPEVTLWFYDKDLRIICEHTGQPYESETRG
jgi:predicted nucleic acid-binding protein